MNRNIVAIGGGEVFVPCQTPETFEIDRYILRIACDNLEQMNIRRRLRFLFIPTASGDDLPYCNSLYVIYNLRLGCDFDHLRILGEKLDDEQVRLKINWADIIYVGGGNTDKMMRAWRRRGVDRLLVKAYQAGKVLCGLSAGAICWFESGVSDSRRFFKPENPNWKPILVKGLGLLPGVCCPHYDVEGGWRVPACEELLRHHPSRQVIALENLCALHVVNGKQYKVFSYDNRKGYLLSRPAGLPVSRQIYEGTVKSWRTNRC